MKLETPAGKAGRHRWYAITDEGKKVIQTTNARGFDNAAAASEDAKKWIMAAANEIYCMVKPRPARPAEVSVARGPRSGPRRPRHRGLHRVGLFQPMKTIFLMVALWSNGA